MSLAFNGIIPAGLAYNGMAVSACYNGVLVWPTAEPAPVITGRSIGIRSESPYVLVSAIVEDENHNEITSYSARDGIVQEMLPGSAKYVKYTQECDDYYRSNIYISGVSASPASATGFNTSNYKTATGSAELVDDYIEFGSTGTVVNWFSAKGGYAASTGTSVGFKGVKWPIAFTIGAEYLHLGFTASGDENWDIRSGQNIYEFGRPTTVKVLNGGYGLDWQSANPSVSSNNPHVGIFSAFSGIFTVNGSASGKVNASNTALKTADLYVGLEAAGTVVASGSSQYTGTGASNKTSKSVYDAVFTADAIDLRTVYGFSFAHKVRPTTNPTASSYARANLCTVSWAGSGIAP